MRTTVVLTPAQLDCNDPGETHLVVSLQGDRDPAGLRPRLGIIPVVDRSGSMGTQHKLQVVTESLRHLSSHLCDEDQVALVAFDNHIDTVLAPLAADEAGMRAFDRALTSLSARGSTNLSGGIQQGIEAGRTMAQRLGDNGIVRVIVLTDGLANVGLTHSEELLALVGDLPPGVTISFLGVGTDCDHDLLGRLAEAGNGSYGFIEEASRAAEVLGAEVGGLLHIDTSNITIEVLAREKFARVGAPLGVKSHIVEKDGIVVGWRVSLGNLLSEQKRHVVFPVQGVAPRRTHARPVTMAEVTITASADDAPLEEKVLPKVHYQNQRGKADPDWAEVVDLAVLADAQAQAETEARQGNFTQANFILNSFEVTSGNAEVLRDAIVMNYGAENYASSAVDRRSSMAMFNGTLAGSSQSFDALAGRTVGGYITSDQRSVANTTMASVSRSLRNMGSEPTLTTPPTRGTTEGPEAALEPQEEPLPKAARKKSAPRSTKKTQGDK